MIYKLLFRAFSHTVTAIGKLDDALYHIYLRELSMRIQWAKNKRDAGWAE